MFAEHVHVQCFSETTITLCAWGHWPAFRTGNQAQGGLPDVPLLEVASVRPQPPWPAGHKDNDDWSDRKVLRLPPPKPLTSPLFLPSLITEKGGGVSAYPGLGRPEGPVSKLCLQLFPSTLLDPSHQNAVCPSPPLKRNRNETPFLEPTPFHLLSVSSSHH